MEKVPLSRDPSSLSGLQARKAVLPFEPQQKPVPHHINLSENWISLAAAALKMCMKFVPLTAVPE